jgi:beta-lactamase superfamily II metal-dependent hydrolase
MLRLRVVQAGYGDCFILEYGTRAHPRYALIDGGPSAIYRKHLRAELQSIDKTGGHLDLTVLSHIDDDHVKGLLDLMDELVKQAQRGLAQTIAIDTLWHNTFSQTVGPDIQNRFMAMMVERSIPEQSIFETSQTDRNIPEGDHLTRDADLLGVPINRGFIQGQPICLDEAVKPAVFGNLRLQILGPTRKNLENLRRDWLAWLQKQGSRDLLAPSDQTIPNLSSLMFLVKVRKKTILFTGDGRSDDLLDGLRQAKLLDAHGCLHVDIFKVPHHGSTRNISKAFFTQVTADRYIISANGRDNNPDLDTLKWIVEAARDQKRKIEIVVTNVTKSTRDLLEQCNPVEFGYQMMELLPDKNSLVIELVS